MQPATRICTSAPLGELANFSINYELWIFWKFFVITILKRLSYIMMQILISALSWAGPLYTDKKRIVVY
jgi:hypothetical protein